MRGTKRSRSQPGTVARLASASGLLAELLPLDIATSESVGVRTEGALFAQERALIANAHPQRRAEFATARRCAHRALDALGVPPAPIPAGASREPVWPEGIVGSITHCPGYHAAAVGRSRRYLSLGIDAEPDMRLPNGVFEEICLPRERTRLGDSGCRHPDRPLFSAKESVYKTWFPVARRWLGFDQVLVTVCADGTFEADVLVPGPLPRLRGRWAVEDGLILTAIALAAGACSEASES
jgi:enterobactin synthetase component D / holo-[acyl-carrier protein] synthase